MLSITECKNLLDEKMVQTLTDAEVLRVRDDLYALAEIICKHMSEKSNPCA